MLLHRDFLEEEHLLAISKKFVPLLLSSQLDSWLTYLKPFHDPSQDRSWDYIEEMVKAGLLKIKLKAEVFYSEVLLSIQAEGESGIYHHEEELASTYLKRKNEEDPPAKKNVSLGWFNFLVPGVPTSGKSNRIRGID